MLIKWKQWMDNIYEIKQQNEKPPKKPWLKISSLSLMFNMFALMFSTYSSSFKTVDYHWNTDSQTLACEKHHTSSYSNTHHTALWADTSQETQIRRTDPNMTYRNISIILSFWSKRARTCMSQHLTRGAMTLIHGKTTFTLRRDTVQNPQIFRLN